MRAVIDVVALIDLFVCFVFNLCSSVIHIRAQKPESSVPQFGHEETEAGVEPRPESRKDRPRATRLRLEPSLPDAQL